MNSWKFWQTILATIVGLICFAIGVNGIMIPQRFMAGGATGVALFLYYLHDGISVGVWYCLINIPILLLAWREMSMRFVTLAIFGVGISTLAMEFTKNITFSISEPLMAAVLAGVVTGTGTGIYLRYGGSAGGLDIVAALLRRRLGIPMGSTFIAVNTCNFLAGGLLHHDLTTAFYTVVAMVVHAKTMEKIQTGFHPRKAVLVITSKPDEIAHQIMKRLNRGVTFLHGSKGRSQAPTRIIYTVINIIELARLKEIIFYYDPEAFISVSDASEVIGYRFVTWAEEGFENKAQRSGRYWSPEPESSLQPMGADMGEPIAPRITLPQAHREES